MSKTLSNFRSQLLPNPTILLTFSHPHDSQRQFHSSCILSPTCPILLQDQKHYQHTRSMHEVTRVSVTLTLIPNYFSQSHQKKTSEFLAQPSRSALFHRHTGDIHPKLFITLVPILLV